MEPHLSGITRRQANIIFLETSCTSLNHTGVGFDRESEKLLSLLMIWAGTSTMKSPGFYSNRIAEEMHNEIKAILDE